ncbi:MAG: efflux transporter outer membrane subunit [Planctomycetes bacterium]|nr:efflux transporter outer membrane subunit [Planctomycetota bacterium]
MAFKAGTLLVFLLTASGCSGLKHWLQNGFKVGPNHVPPAAPVSDAWIDRADPRVKNAPAEDCAWWTLFNDPTLNRLIDTAYRQNLDLQTAGTRILEARAQRHIAAGNLFPQSQAAIAGLAHAQFGPNLGLPLPHTLNIWADGFNASWEIDFWGRYRRSIEAADANLQASTERYGEALVMVLSEVAANYVQMRTFEQRLQYAQENIAIQKKSLELVEARIEQGAGTELDECQARSNLALTESLVPPLEAGRRLACNRLCILLGMPVTDLATQIEAASIPVAPPEVAVGIPADLLCRRPDIRRAERQVAAQCAQIGIAESDLYPRLGVSGFIGYAANDLGDLFSSKNFTSFIIPSLQWNILNYGRIVNNVATQEARLQATTLQYQQTVLTAGREVEDGLVQFIQAQQQARRLEDGVSQAERSVELVVKQFEGGITDFNRVFTTQAQLVTQQDQLATARGNIALNLIQVYRAMGGGWESIAEGHGMPNLINSVDAEGIPQSPASIH